MRPATLRALRWLLPALMTAACSTPASRAPEPADAPRVERDPAPPLPPLELPAGWATLDAEGFERALARVAEPAGEPTPEQVAELERALVRGGQPGLRAAVLLGRARGPRAGEALLAQLERRDARSDGVPSELAARAFARGATARAAQARLEQLALGPEAHPRPAVRVECAASSLALGGRRAQAFLLAVWRGAQGFGLAESELAPLQERALGALAERAGTQPAATPWSSAAQREAEARRLEQLLAPARRKP